MYDNVTRESESGFKFVVTFVNKSDDTLKFSSTTTSINVAVVDIAGKTDGSKEISTLELKGNKTAENVENLVLKAAVYCDNVSVKLDKITELDAIFAVYKDEKALAYETIHLAPCGEVCCRKIFKRSQSRRKGVA